MINRVPPIVSTGPQTYGPGRVVAHISDTITRTTTTTVSSYNLGERLKENVEFQETIEKYQYFKILGIKVILKPFNYVNTSETGAFMINWDSDISDTDFFKNDSVKVFGPVNHRMKVWRFLPPDMVIGTTNTATAPVHLQSYINAARFVVPCWFHVIVGFQGFVEFQIEWILEFRGLAIVSTQTKINRLLERVNLLKEKLKEENKKKEEDNEKTLKNSLGNC